MLKNTRPHIFALLLLLIGISNIRAQEFLPFIHSPYAGVSVIGYQPADIAASRYRFDMSIIDFSTQEFNDYLGLERSQLFKFGNYDTKDYHKKYLKQNLNGDAKNALVNARIGAAGFMLALDEKSSIAFTSRARTFVNADNISEDLAVLLYNNLDYEPLLDQKLTNQNIRTTTSTWAEYGISYARVVLNQGPHMIKAGATLKILQGLGGAFMYADILDYSVHNEDSISIYNTQFRYGTSENLEKDFSYKFVANPSLGLDLGAVYLYRPDHEEYRYSMDGSDEQFRRDLYDYKFKAGISVTDLGYINYDKGYNSQDFIANVENWNISDIKIDNVQDLTDTLINRFGTNGTETSFKMQLPTVINMQFDYQLYKRLFLNFSPYLAIRQGNADIHKVHHFSNFSLMPHYETYGFGVSMPLQYNSLGQFNAGLGFRFGMFWIGSNTLLGSMFKDVTRDVDIHFAFKIPVRYKGPKDRDGDRISDAKDLCPDIAGIAQFQGCPDTDLDGVPDHEDDCPQIPGLKELKGCPAPEVEIEIPAADSLIIEDTTTLIAETPVVVAEEETETVVELPAPEPVQLPETSAIGFKLNSAKLKESSYPALDKIVAFMNGHSDYDIVITGYTDTTGKADYNKSLSLKRAKSVAKYLTEKGVAGQRIKTEGMGEENPIATNETLEGRRKNRRVEFTIVVK